MTSWGYRVYTFELFESRSQRKDALHQDIEEHRALLLEAVNLVSRETRVAKPQRSSSVSTQTDDLILDESDGYQNTKTTLRVRGVTYSSELRAIHANIALGDVGLHDLAVGISDNEDDYSVREHSTEAPRRVDIFFPRSGAKGMIVAETIGRRDPISLLISWINHLSQKQRNERLQDIDETKTIKDEDGKEITKTEARGRVPRALRVEAKRVADPDQLQEIIDSISSMDTVFTQTDSSNRKIEKKLVIKVKEQRTMREIIETISGDQGEEKIIEQSLETLNLDQGHLGKTNLDFDSMKAQVRSDEGNVTLVPGKFSDLFNYKFENTGNPTNNPYYETTLAKVKKLIIPAGIALDVPDVNEMVDWVDSEEKSWSEASFPKSQ